LAKNWQFSSFSPISHVNFGDFCADSADCSVKVETKLAMGLSPPKSPKVPSYKINPAVAVRKTAAAMAAKRLKCC
jgi:hypothetical protein